MKFRGVGLHKNEGKGCFGGDVRNEKYYLSIKLK